MRHSYPTPRIDEGIDSLGDATFFPHWKQTAATIKSKLTTVRAPELCLRHIMNYFWLFIWGLDWKAQLHIPTCNRRHCVQSPLEVRLVYMDDNVTFSKSLEAHKNTWDTSWRWFAMLSSLSNQRSANSSTTLSTTSVIISYPGPLAFSQHTIDAIRDLKFTMKVT